MNNLIIRKITLSAMFIALGLILERLVMIPIGEVNRIAFGSSAIILASLIVGPIFGAVVGASVDVFGFFLNSVGTYTPYVTIGWAVLGILPWLFMHGLKWLRKTPGYFYLSYLLLGGLLTYGLWFIYTRESYLFNMGGGNFVEVALNNVWVRVILPLVALTIFFGFITFVIFLQNKFKGSTKFNDIRELVFIVLISEILISIVWGVQWRVWYLNVPPLALYFNQVAFFVIAFPMKSLVVVTGMRTYQNLPNRSTISSR